MVSASASVRNAFLELLDDEPQGDAACTLAANLVDCTDILPYEYCEMLSVPPGTTFGLAARQVRASLGCTD